MGNWKITIHGHGIHHNKRPDDADVIARVFAGQLQAAGHQLDKAELQLTDSHYAPDASAPTDLLSKESAA